MPRLSGFNPDVQGREPAGRALCVTKPSGVLTPTLIRGGSQGCPDLAAHHPGAPRTKFITTSGSRRQTSVGFKEIPW